MTYTDFFASVNAVYIMLGIVIIGAYLALILHKLNSKNSKKR